MICQLVTVSIMGACSPLLPLALDLLSVLSPEPWTLPALRSRSFRILNAEELMVVVDMAIRDVLEMCRLVHFHWTEQGT
jgi:hypothetical protein